MNNLGNTEYNNYIESPEEYVENLPEIDVDKVVHDPTIISTLLMSLDCLLESIPIIGHIYALLSLIIQIIGIVIISIFKKRK